MTWEECIVRFLLSWSALDVQSTTAQASGPALSSSSSSPPSLRERFRLLIWCVSSYQESIVLQVILNLLRQEGVDRSHGMNYYCANGWHIRYFAFNSVLYVVEALCVSAHVEYDGLFPFRPRSMWCLVFFFEMVLILWHCIILHCMAWHLELCRDPMVATIPVQHHLSMQLHTLLGTKAGVHVHLYAFLYGLRVGCDEIYCDILWIVISHIALRLIGLWTNYMWLYGYLDIGLM